MKKTLEKNGLWRFETKNFLVIVDENCGVWRTIIYFGKFHKDEIVRHYGGSAVFGFRVAIHAARREMIGNQKIIINQRINQR